LWYRNAIANQGAEAAAGVRATIDAMIDAAASGNLRQGFALYTSRLLADQQQSLGLDAAEFEQLLRSAATPPQRPISVQSIDEIVLDPPHRASAIVRYAPGDKGEGLAERIAFVLDPERRVWLIDAIERAPVD
jgi:hypothetical protein